MTNLADETLARLLYECPDGATKLRRGPNQIGDEIATILTRKAYRPRSLSDHAKRTISTAVEISVRANAPIKITVPFGGYKNWRLRSSPYPDFSEVFHILTLRDYATPICAIYQPGVEITYYSLDIFIERMNGYPIESLNIYNVQLASIMSMLNARSCPTNMTIQLRRLRETANIENAMDIMEASFRNTERSEQTPDREMPHSVEYLYSESGIEPTDQEAAGISKRWFDAFRSAPWWREVSWAFGDGLIPTSSSQVDWGVSLYSVRGSVVQFWVGEGFFRRAGDRLIPTIGSVQQLRSIGEHLDYVPVSVLGDMHGLGAIGVMREVS